jgi:hypothetical protein
LKKLAVEVDETLNAYYNIQLGSSPDWNKLERKLELTVFNEKKAQNNDDKASKLKILREILKKCDLSGDSEKNYWDLAIEYERHHVMNYNNIP